MTIKKFMTMDLMVLSIMAIVVDTIGYFASRSELVFFYISLSIPIMLIAYIRWGYKALVINGVVVVLHLILYGTSDLIATMLYALSLMSIGVALVWFKFVPKNAIKHEVLLITLYFLSAYTLLFFIQALAQYSIGLEVQWVTLFIRHMVNVVLGWVILMIASRQEDFMVDMKKYLLKQIEDRKDEGLEK